MVGVFKGKKVKRSRSYKLRYYREWKKANKEHCKDYWIKNKKSITIGQWKRRGVKTPEGLSFEELHDFYESVPDCELCGIELSGEVRNQRRCLDHSHVSGDFRAVICHLCNIKAERGT